MKTAAIILYVIQAVAILCAIITGQEFIDFSSGPALFETIGFFSPAILGAILEMIANNKEQKAKSTAEDSNADNVAPSASSAPKAKAAASSATASAPQKAPKAPAPQKAPKKDPETTAAAAKCQPVIDPSVQYCPKCGTKQNAGNVFCIACGSKLGQ